MHISINLNTDELDPKDAAVLRAVAEAIAPSPKRDLDSGSETVQADRKAEQATAKKAAPAAKKAAAPKAAAPKAEPEPQEDASEDVVGGAATLDDAIDRATELVKAGKLAEVKAALKEAGVKKVGELPTDKIAGFLTALEDE